MKTVIILGSSRKSGDTAKIINEVIAASNDWDLINLNDYEIGHYDYEYKNKEDDYLPLMRELIKGYDNFIFATPVYWYAMSGVMKVFFDRITDLLDVEKELGRKLRGKNMAVVSVSRGNNLGEAFWLPFSESANYLGMKYLGGVHMISGERNTNNIKELISLIENLKE